ncbi:MAG: response regulator transcription factor [Saprospiraceae bacterium]
MEYKIALFDDHPIIVEALNLYFGKINQIKILGSYSDSDDLLVCMQDNEIDFLIADIITEQEMGLHLFEIISTKYPKTKVITYSSVTSDIVLDELQKYGVIASIHKTQHPEVIFDCIKQYSFRKTNKIPEPKSYRLSPKEKEIARFLVKGLAAKEIASLTNTAVNTINNQKNTLLEKFECANSTELIVKLTQLGLLNVL